jgi:hypothetical protein
MGDAGIFTEVRALPVVFIIELLTETARALFPPVHGDGCDTNSVVTASQDHRPTRYNYNRSRKRQGIVWFF